MAAGGVAWERKWLQEVWPGRGSDCRGVAWERESLKNGTMEGDREGRFERREQLASAQALRLHTNHIPQWYQYHTASDGRLGGRG